MITYYKDNKHNVLASGGAQRYWHGTLEAYEANKDKIPPNTMICITNDNGAVPQEYTLDEQVIGIWADNKILYRKIYENKTATFSVADLNIDKVISLKGMVENAAGAVHEIPYEDMTGTQYIKTIYYNKNDKNIYIHSAGDNIVNSLIIVEYTKV